ncbi:unnamed protein product [Psylliodes chrysocephalus]|uniref:Uncharacterized protein n=1 Tax=Psylliodes chrysocephalus TaxID=3402493 RepID=A0A9P0G4G1_9CUCU|nr:unnamed protein product [Psylliodes chrysocephala]
MDEKTGSNVVDVGVDLSEFYMSVEWDILEVPAVRNEKFYTCCDEPYLDITFNITMRRKTLFYTVNIIIPCMGISFLTVLTFYLPSDSGEKVTLSISILISLHVFFLLVVEIIPPTSLVVPLLGKYLIFAMILVSISICVTVVVLNVHFRSPQTHRMSPWVKRVFIHILPRLLVMKRPTYIFETKSKFLSNRFVSRTRQYSTCLYPYHTTVHREDGTPKRRYLSSRTPSKEDISPRLADGGPFGGSCQIHGPLASALPLSEAEELDGGGGGNENGIKSPVLCNPAYSHSRCPPEIHKSCFCVRFIAEHTKMLEDSTKDYSSDEDSFDDFQSTSSDNCEDEIKDMNQKIGFLNQMQLDLSKLDVGDWIVVKFKQEKAIKMYVRQLTEKEPCLEAKFCRRFGQRRLEIRCYGIRSPFPVDFHVGGARRHGWHNPTSADTLRRSDTH